MGFIACGGVLFLKCNPKLRVSFLCKHLQARETGHKITKIFFNETCASALGTDLVKQKQSYKYLRIYFEMIAC